MELHHPNSDQYHIFMVHFKVTAKSFVLGKSCCTLKLIMVSPVCVQEQPLLPVWSSSFLDCSTSASSPPTKSPWTPDQRYRYVHMSLRDLTQKLISWQLKEQQSEAQWFYTDVPALVFRLRVSQHWVLYSWPWAWRSSESTGWVERREILVAIKVQTHPAPALQPTAAPLLQFSGWKATFKLLLEAAGL